MFVVVVKYTQTGNVRVTERNEFASSDDAMRFMLKAKNAGFRVYMTIK